MHRPDRADERTVAARRGRHAGRARPPSPASSPNGGRSCSSSREAAATAASRCASTTASSSSATTTCCSATSGGAPSTSTIASTRCGSTPSSSSTSARASRRASRWPPATTALHHPVAGVRVRGARGSAAGVRILPYGLAIHRLRPGPVLPHQGPEPRDAERLHVAGLDGVRSRSACSISLGAPSPGSRWLSGAIDALRVDLS